LIAAILQAGEEVDSGLDKLVVDGDNIKGRSLFMLDTDRRGADPCPCADRLKLHFSGFVWYRMWEIGSSVTVGPGSGIEARS
jgi:hypothetical protein